MIVAIYVKAFVKRSKSYLSDEILVALVAVILCSSLEFYGLTCLYMRPLRYLCIASSAEG